MSLIVQLIQREPALVAGFAQSALAVATAFGLALTAGQVAALLGLIGIAAAIWTRSRVSPVKP